MEEKNKFVLSVLRRVRIKLEGREPDALRKVGLHYKLYNVRVSLWWTGSSTFIFVRLQVLYHIYLSSTYSRIKSRSHCFRPPFLFSPYALFLISTLIIWYFILDDLGHFQNFAPLFTSQESYENSLR